MIHLRPHPIYENQSDFPKSKDEVKAMCKKMGLKEYLINEDLSIDLFENYRHPIGANASLPLKINEVMGHFSFKYSTLKSLEGFPSKVGGNVDISWNNLRDFKGDLKVVNKHLFCDTNIIRTLEGFPYVHGSINIQRNPIYRIVGKFISSENKNKLIQEFNHYNITDGDVVYLDRLEMFISDFDLKMPDLNEIKTLYKIIT